MLHFGDSCNVICHSMSLARSHVNVMLSETLGYPNISTKSHINF